LGHEVIVAHARNVRLIGESRKKDDRLDAQTLAGLLMEGDYTSLRCLFALQSR
jgi:transposase